MQFHFQKYFEFGTGVKVRKVEKLLSNHAQRFRRNLVKKKSILVGNNSKMSAPRLHILFIKVHITLALHQTI